MRLLRTKAAHPAWNLAVDEAILRAGTPTLRFYAWDPPGYSLGFFQKLDEHAIPEGFVPVRRPTGGGAIAHHDELTVSWIGARAKVDDVYARVNATVTRALESLGLEVTRGSESPEAAPKGLCFDAHTCYDLMLGDRKVFGSAQRRARERFLLHGSLVVRRNAMSRGAVSLEEALGRPVSATEVEAVIRMAWEESLEEGPLTDAERTDAERLVKERYANPDWTARR